MNEKNEHLVLNHINLLNELNFKNGGIAIPKFKSLEEARKFKEEIDKIFPSSSGNKKFNECRDDVSIEYDIPYRFLK